MANLKSLVKLRKHSVDEKQKVLAELYRQIEIIENQKTMLIERLRTERLALDKESSLEMFAYFGRFSQNIQRNIEKLNQDKAKLEGRISIAQDDVRTAFADMKRIEIVQRERDKADKKKADDKASREMDDIGIDGFRRQQEDIDA